VPASLHRSFGGTTAAAGTLVEPHPGPLIRNPAAPRPSAGWHRVD